ncbi:MAG: efflux RND transporter periplasmic adaptor subunit [Chloroflexi bacterium]|nr:efflux RND transporter periplasmic adaptor subunit [Chloroflexota bacterium]
MKRRLILAGGVVLIVLVIAGVFGVQRMTASAATTKQVQTATVTRGSLAATVNASGNVSALSSAALGFTSSGRVAQVAVKVGDQVKTGQLLMQLDTTDLQLSLKTAQSNLASQRASFDATQANLQFALKTAQANLASAQANYDSAKAKNATNLDQLIVAKAALDKARVTLEQAQGAYNAIAWRSDIGMTTQAATLQTATSDYNSALANYKITAATINDTALRTAQASLDNAQVSLEQAQKNLDTSTRTAQASLDNATVSVEQAQRNLDNAALKAPFDGIVAAVNFSAGDSASGTAVNLVDLSKLQVKVTVAEVDMAKIKVDEPAQMTLDALSGKTYKGTVTAIAPVATVTSGVVNYTVIVSIANADADIRPGMTASLVIEVEHRDNVLLIPSRAVRSSGNVKTVSVLDQGQPVQTPISTGLAGDSMIEVTNGLKEGDVVVVNTTQTTSSNRGTNIAIPGLGGPAGPPP